MTTSADPTKQITYADAGVDVDEGARAVDAIKAAVATTTRPEVIGGLGGFGSCFSAAAHSCIPTANKSVRPIVLSNLIATASPN